MADAFGMYNQTEQGWWMYITYHILSLGCRNKQIEFITQMFQIGFYNANLSKHKG